MEGKHTVYRMSASTEEEKDDWIKCIQWVDLARLVKSSPPIAEIFLFLVSLRLHGASLDRTRVLVAKLLQNNYFVTNHFSKEQNLCNNLAKPILVGRQNIYLAEGISSRASISTNPFYDMMSQRQAHSVNILILTHLTKIVLDIDKSTYLLNFRWF